ncbi:MAG: CTP synthetase [Chloroflexi bacterium]|nr:CTP synthetase [Chloroflexota bacterium]|tara:strand:- start:1813 stop:3453 length:1641 start_codon:yes stop_codon:yes gene_type:complete
MSKYIFVTGGVVSSVGKGIATASIGKILKSGGVAVSVIKLDPYLNVDPGTMSPFQHGEVFVTGDGSETDLDLGHYERFIDIDLTKSSNITSGQIYSDVISRERRGEFLGGTIQSVPHVTDAIKAKMINLADESKADIIIVEVGGTVGDIEGLPFLEAIRQMRNEVGKDNVFYIHLTYLPFIATTGELKTKPTQHSVRELRSIGIQPDAIICRSEQEFNDDIKSKIAVHCDVPKNCVISAPTLESVYEVPIMLYEEGLADIITDAFSIPKFNWDIEYWEKFVRLIKAPKNVIKVGIIGKYVDLHDAYISVKESLLHAGFFHEYDIDLVWINSEEVNRNNVDDYLGDLSGIVVPGGFGYRGVEGMIETVRYARENKIPYFGLCLGMQVMVIEASRNLLRKPEANSTEFEADTPDPVIDLMIEQRDIKNLGGTMRLGVYECVLLENTKVSEFYDVRSVFERHRHRFEFNNDYKVQLSEVGLIASGQSPDGLLVEIMEIEGHPFMIGTQFHPEFLSRPDSPHPLFREFVGSAIKTMLHGSQHEMELESLG